MIEKGLNYTITRALLFSLLLGYFNLSFAQGNSSQKPARILFLLDASSSMLNDWKPKENRYKTASRIVMAIMDSIHNVNTDVEFALRMIGSEHPAQEKNCFDSRLEVPFGNSNRSTIQTRLHQISPKGFTPVAWSLAQAAEYDFIESNYYAYSIILITDGGESCGGDICATVENLLNKKISFKPYILSMVDYEPLKKQYECLGKYFTVAKENDITNVINTIIEDNRKILTVKSAGLKTVKVNEFAVHAKEITTEMPPNQLASNTETKKTEAPITLPAPLQIDRISSINTIRIKKTNVAKVIAVKKQEPRLPAIVIEKEEEPVVQPKAVELKFIKRIVKLSSMNMLYVLADVSPIKVPRLPAIKIPLETESFTAKSTTSIAHPSVTIAKSSKVSATSKPKMNATDTVNLAYKVTPVADKKTTLQVYFTNGAGKYYNTEPRMVFVDADTKKMVKSVYRNVTAGQPNPITIEGGTYNIIIPGGRSKVTNVKILPDNANRVEIVVGKGSMAFYYPTSSKKPVKEYYALVSPFLDKNNVIKQNCDEELAYEPGNYHVEINTLPPIMYNIDLTFNDIKLLSIPEPGTVQITNANKMGKVQFWYLHGDAFQPFYEMVINGDLTQQKAKFLPGTYQVRYFKQPEQPYQKASVFQFLVKRNETVSVELAN